MRKERKTAAESRDGALSNGASRALAEYLEMVREFGDGRDLDGVAGLYPAHRALDGRVVCFETPESILIAREEDNGSNGVCLPAPELEETGRRELDTGSHIRVNGVLLADRLEDGMGGTAEDEEDEKEPDEAGRALVARDLRAFEQDGVRCLGLRRAVKLTDGYSRRDYGESRVGNRPLKERPPGFARSRRRLAAALLNEALFAPEDGALAAA